MTRSAEPSPQPQNCLPADVRCELSAAVDGDLFFILVVPLGGVSIFFIIIQSIIIGTYCTLRGQARASVWGGTLPWPLLAICAVGVVLMFSRLLFGAQGSMADSDHLVGALFITIAGIALPRWPGLCDSSTCRSGYG